MDKEIVVYASGEYYKEIKWNELQHLTTKMNLNNMMPRERSLTQKRTDSMSLR